MTLIYGKEGGNNTVTTITEKATGKTLQLHYNEKGYLVKVTDETGRATKFTYKDKCLTSITNSLGEVISYKYDENGNQTEIRDAYGENQTTTYEYD
ncbi:MAG: RHS repeat protein [Lachnospiraceae bacterium]|nr:RHS repeat protein [Lachnospiraceae bacterium]